METRRPSFIMSMIWMGKLSESFWYLVIIRNMKKIFIYSNKIFLLRERILVVTRK